MMTNLEVRLAAYGVLLDTLLRQLARTNPDVVRGVIDSAMSTSQHKPPKNATSDVIHDAKRINDSLIQAIEKLRRDTGL